MGHTRTAVRGDAGYPPRLAALRRPPERVFLEGPGDHDGPSIAIVGARAATGDGLDVARELAAALAARGVAVLSGLAHGIDAAAHEGALDAGGRSGAVLGTPLGRVYPREHRALQARVARSLGLLSELPPGAPATRGTFAARNRLLAALSDAVILVQGRAGSGALNTVRAALEIGRPVGAVPWDPRDEFGEAPLALARARKAELIRDADDAMELLDPLGAAGRAPGADSGASRREREESAAALAAAIASLSPGEARLLAALRHRREPLEAIARRAAMPLPEAGAAFVALEILDLARREPGGLVRRVRTG
ncbi:MAG TPA: DNA-processing protein DprA [Candidatus Eisenbacteria bacterium]|nr:DNA-processing protein DprA [Candidatus Eisenbacteria bacterium]